MGRIVAIPSGEYRRDLGTFCEMTATRREESSALLREWASVNRRKTRQRNSSKLEVKADSSALPLCLKCRLHE